jgi:hypothetical protein
VDDWRLINLAASASTEVYKDLREVAASWKMEPSELSNLKSATISVAEFEGRRTLVVSVRGSTAARRDWMVNANGRPMASRKVRQSCVGARRLHHDCMKANRRGDSC